MAEATVDTLRRGYEALNARDLSEVMALIDDEIVWAAGDLSPDAEGEAVGGAAFETFVRSWIDAFDEFRVEPVEVIEEGPCLIALVHQSGRGRASGVPIEIDIAHVWTIEGEKAVRLQSFRNADEAFAAVRASRA